MSFYWCRNVNELSIKYQTYPITRKIATFKPKYAVISVQSNSSKDSEIAHGTVKNSADLFIKRITAFCAFKCFPSSSPDSNPCD